MPTPAGEVASRLFFHSCVYFLVLLGTVKSINIVVHHSSVRGYEGGALLLQTSYHLCQPTPFLQIKWNMVNSSTVIIMHTIRQASSSSNQELTNKSYPSEQYRQRVTVFPESGSLLIQKLLLSDQGQYQVTLKDDESSASAIINVTVSRNREQHEARHCACPGNSSTDGYPITLEVLATMRTISIVVSTLFFLCLHLLVKRHDMKKKGRRL